MEFRIEYEDMANPYLKHVAENNPRWVASALKAAGYEAQKFIKAQIKSQAPGGQTYAKHVLNDTQYARLEKELTGRYKRSYPIMGRLQKAVGYDKSQADSGVVTVGWLSRSAVAIGEKQQAGYTTPLTDRMRKAFFAAGLHPSKTKETVFVQSRQTFEPLRPLIEQLATAKVQAKLLSYVNGNQARSEATGKRIYKVYR